MCKNSKPGLIDATQMKPRERKRQEDNTREHIYAAVQESRRRVGWNWSKRNGGWEKGESMEEYKGGIIIMQEYS